MSILLEAGKTKEISVPLTPVSPWVSPVGHSGGDWSDRDKAYDNKLNTCAWTETEGAELLLLPPGEEINCDKVRIYCGTYNEAIGEYQNADITVSVDNEAGQVVVIFSGIVPMLAWFEIPVGNGPYRYVGLATVKWNSFNGGDYGDLYEFQFRRYPS